MFVECIQPHVTVALVWMETSFVRLSWSLLMARSTLNLIVSALKPTLQVLYVCIVRCRKCSKNWDHDEHFNCARSKKGQLASRFVSTHRKK